jgi:streptogramin lyase
MILDGRGNLRGAMLVAGALAISLVIGLAGCSGDSSNSPIPAPTLGPTSTPTSAPPTPTPAPTASPTPVPPGSISGSVSGGVGPIVGAQVTLYKAGNAYGSGATALGAVTSDAQGSFTIPFTPPATPQLLYIVVTGGNTGAASNLAIGLMGVVGLSNDFSNPIRINELTTVAGEWALAQFLDSSGQIAGAPATNQVGLLNAAATAGDNLADISTGDPASFLPTALDCSSGLPPNNCDTLDRLNTLGNILASCVQSTGASPALPLCAAANSPCDILFACTGTPSNATTLQAAHSIALNPAANVSRLFAAQQAPLPYQPSLLAPPEGFEIALGLFPLAARISSPLGIAADSGGNIWIANSNIASVVELSPTGRFVGRFNPAGSNFDNPFDIEISAAGDVWVSNSNGASLTQLDGNGNLIANRAPAGANLKSPLGIAIDANDNVWTANLDGNSVSELLASGNYATGLNFAPAGAAFNGPVMLAFDAAANLWASNYNGNSVSELTAASSYGTGVNFSPAGASLASPLGLGLDSSSNLWTTNFAASHVSELTSASSYATGVSLAPPGAVLSHPAGLKIDSANNVWTVNFDTGTLSELVAGCSTVSCSAINLDPVAADLNTPYGIDVDASGNIWITNSGGNSISEFIGLAAPTNVPSVCLKKGQPASCRP